MKHGELTDIAVTFSKKRTYGSHVSNLRRDNSRKDVGSNVEIDHFRQPSNLRRQSSIVAIVTHKQRREVSQVADGYR